MVTSIRGRKILFVEDNMVIGLYAQAVLEDNGAQVTIVTNVADALTYLMNARPDVAILDVHLEGETSFTLANELIARDIAVLFTTGGQIRSLEGPLAKLPIISKPFSERRLMMMVIESIQKDRPSNCGP